MPGKPCDPAFRRRLARAVRLFLRELRDGCVDCRLARGYCAEHARVARDCFLHPRKYVTI